MDKIYYKLDVIGKYLSTSLKPVKFIFNKQYVVNNQYLEPLIKKIEKKIQFSNLI